MNHNFFEFSNTTHNNPSATTHQVYTSLHTTMDTLPNDANVIENLNKELAAVQALLDERTRECKRLRAGLDALLRIPSDTLMEEMLTGQENDDYDRPWPRVNRRIAEKLTIAAGGKRRRVESADAESD